MRDEQYRRKAPEEILKSIQKMEKGRLKIILGAVSGSGKTYHMLQQGNVLKKRGVDVVIGFVYASNRPKTIEQIGSIERIPSIEWESNGKMQQDLDVDAILARNPEVVLVDALSHRNRPESPYATRLEDIHVLLSNNISVITTVNVYELEGVGYEAGKLTGRKVKVDCYIPENTLALADEVKLLDVTPEVILHRLQEGSIEQTYEERQGHNHFFQRSNLAVLRELALRFFASEVNDTLDEYRGKHGMIGASGASEK